MKLEIRYENSDFLTEVLKVDKLSNRDVVQINPDTDAYISRLSTQLSGDAISLLELSLSIGAGLTANILHGFLKQLWEKGGRDLILLKFKSYLGTIRIRSSLSEEQIQELLQPWFDSYQQLEEERDSMIDQLKSFEDELAIDWAEENILSPDMEGVEEEVVQEINDKLSQFSFAHIEELAAKDQIKEALKELLVVSPTQELANNIIIQMSRLNRNNDDFIKGVITRETYLVERRRIISNILNLKKDFEA